MLSFPGPREPLAASWRNLADRVYFHEVTPCRVGIGLGLLVRGERVNSKLSCPTIMSQKAVFEEAGVVYADNDKLAQVLDTKVIKDGAKADKAEHEMTIVEAFRVHKKAIFWSMALSAALIMEGYDVVVIGSYYGHRTFLDLLHGSSH